MDSAGRELAPLDRDALGRALETFAAEGVESIAITFLNAYVNSAHEQAAAYCERLDISLADYARRFSASPAKFLDTESDAPLEYHERLAA